MNFSRMDLATKLATARDSNVSLATRAQAIFSLQSWVGSFIGESIY